MIFLRGVNVIRIVELGASFAQGLFSRKLDLAESHVREMNMKYKYAMKIPVQVMIKRLNRILTQHICRRLLQIVIYIGNFILLVNCLWNEFGPWSNCTEECDGGTQTRVRTIQQEAAFGGMTCQGYATESRNCNEEPCQRKYLIKDVISIQNELGIHKTNLLNRCLSMGAIFSMDAL